MLLTIFPNLKENKVIKALNKFLYSYYYVILIGLLILANNILAFDLACFYIVGFLGAVIPSLFCEDMFPMVAPLAMTYSAASIKCNNTKYGTSLFKGTNKILLFVIIAFVLTFVLSRLVFELVKNKEKRHLKPALWMGYVFLGVCFVLGGLLSPYYESKTVIYGLVTFLTLSVCYFLLLYLIDWKKVNKDYFAYLMTAYGLVVTFEVIYMQIAIKAGNTAFISDIGQLFTGWGMRNNIAGQISLCIAAPIYLAMKKKYGFIYLILTLLIFLGVVLTNSRGGTLTSLVVMLIALIIYFIYTNKRKRIEAGIVYAASIIAVGIVFIAFKDRTMALIKHFYEDIDLEHFDLVSFSGNRNLTWEHGIEHFSENELLGVGFYQCKDYAFFNFSTSFIPPRYHNIYIQFAACTGLLGLAAYGFHRAQTLLLTFKRATLEKTFIYLSILALVLSSLTDNTFFNFGPGLNYCIALAFIEGMNIQDQSSEKEIPVVEKKQNENIVCE